MLTKVPFFPLAAIKTFAEFLPDRYEDADFRGKFSRIVQSEIERINGIVRQLLDLAKPVPLELQPVDLGRILHDTGTLLSNQCMKQAVDVSVSVEESGLVMEGDPAQLKQVVLNLLMNAIEAMEHGGNLTVSCQKGERELNLCISDTGAGISPENLKQIWDPFFTTKARGMGLGLAVVRDIIERHSGTIAIRSRLGEGTRIDIRLPLTQPSSKPAS
jgi:signal transduction histidine kinase